MAMHLPSGHWSHCPNCVALDIAQHSAEAQSELARARHEARQKRIGASGVPPRFAAATLQTFQANTDQQRRVLEYAMAYVDDLESVVRTGRCLILVGGVGTGKTHLACAIARVAIERGYCARFETVQRALRRIKDAWRAVDTTESSVVDQFCQPDLLVLDEVGVQTGSDFEKNLIFDVINERYEQRRPTILLSNLDSDGVKQYLGPRVTDRLREDGGRMFACDWESYRRRV